MRFHPSAVPPLRDYDDARRARYGAAAASEAFFRTDRSDRSDRVTYDSAATPC